MILFVAFSTTYSDFRLYIYIDTHTIKPIKLKGFSMINSFYYVVEVEEVCPSSYELVDLPIVIFCVT